MHHRRAYIPLVIGFFVGGAFGFTAPRASCPVPTSARTALHAEGGDDSAAAAADENDVIARRIVVTGDVDGGYYRSCIKNEASRYRSLIGTMSPPYDDDDKQAEIYIEGKRKMVDGFVRWCKRGKVGLSQQIEVNSVVDEYPTGIYDDFYVETGRKVEDC